MNRFLPRVLVVAVAATFALAGCGRDDDRSTSNRMPGGVTGTTGGTASSPTTPGSTPSPSAGGSAMSGGGAAPSGSTGASANEGHSSPSGTSGGAMSSRSGDDVAGSGGGGGAPSIPAGGTAGTSDGTTAPAGSAGGTSSSDTGAATSGTPGTGSSSAGSTSSTGTTGTGTTTGNPTPSSTPGKSSSLGTHPVGANVQLVADTPTAPPAAKLSRADKEFIEEAASGGLTEVEVGKIMAQRSGHSGVRQFAEMLVKDHTQANEELRRIAASAGVSLPATPEAKHRAMIERLANEKGADLDRTFIRNFGVKEHEKDIRDFRKQADNGENPQLRAFAAKTLPKLQEHLAMAQKLESELGK
jgi:putative membrane protein